MVRLRLGTGDSYLDQPEGVVASRSGTLYVADTFNDCIRTVTTSGILSSLAGICGSNEGYADGTGAAAQFGGPEDLAFDSSGNLHIADSANNCIRKITPSAVATTFAGTCDGGSRNEL